MGGLGRTASARPEPVRSNLRLGQAWICFGLAWPMNSPSNHHVHGFRFIWLWITTNGSQTVVGVLQAVDFGGPQEYSYWTIRRLQIELLVQSELFFIMLKHVSRVFCWVRVWNRVCGSCRILAWVSVQAIENGCGSYVYSSQTPPLQP